MPLGKPAKGKLLISEPFLLDPGFKRTVVLLTEHNDDGSVGFVLNKPLNVKLNDAITEFPDFEAPIYLGGPVQPDTLHYIHTIGDKLEDSIEVKKGLYWAGDYELLKILIETGQVEPNDFRFFVGYSGWSPGQLEDEMKAKSWIVTNAKAKDVFSKEPEQLWRDVLKKMGKGYAVISNYPEDPNLN